MSTEPLSFEQLDQMRRALADLEVVDNGLTGVKGRYGWSDRGVSKTVNMLADLSLLLAEVERLRELKCETCGMRVAHLNCNGYVIGWGCADGEKCTPASGMPHTPAEETCPRSPLTPPVHVRAFPYDDPCRACVYCGAIPPLERTSPRAILAAQEGRGDADTAGTETDRGTGVAEAPGSAQEAPVDIAARILVGSDWDDEDAWNDETRERDHIRDWAASVDNELRPVHFREAAASLRNYAHRGLHPERFRAFRDAADLLDSAARDLEDGA